MAAVLALALAVQVAMVSNQLLRTPHPIPAPARTMVPARSGPGPAVLNVEAIVSAHLFGLLDSRAADAPESKAGLVLSGTIAMSNPEQGLAFIGESPASSKLYMVGAQMPGGVRLQQVFTDHVVLIRQNFLEKLTMARRGPYFSAAPAVSASQEVPQEKEVAAVVAAQTAGGANPEYPPGNKPWE